VPAHLERLSVRLTTIDSLALPSLNFVKLDIEGYEQKALLGALDTLRRESAHLTAARPSPLTLTLALSLSLTLALTPTFAPLTRTRTLGLAPPQATDQRLCSSRGGVTAGWTWSTRAG
jgi:hypothetical protein